MPQKKGSNNYDALGSIFDFIFTEAEKKPDKRRPIKPTGISGNDQLTDAIAASLELPGAFVSNTIVDEFNGALEFEISANTYRGVGKLKVTSNNLVDLLKDPKAFVEKNIATTQAIRKGMRAKFAGEYMTDLLNNAWAHKYGDDEVKQATYGIAKARQLKEAKKDDSFKISKAIGEATAGRISEADKTYVAGRSLELVGRKVFGSSDWQSMNEVEKEKFRSIVLSDISEPEKGHLKGYLAANYAPDATKYLSNYEQAYRTVKNGKSVDLDKDIFNSDTYLHLEAREIDRKIDEIKARGTGTPEEQQRIAMYEKTKMLIGREAKNLGTEIANIKSKLKGVSDPVQKKELQRELKDARSALRAVNGSNFFGQIGKAEGILNSYNNVYGGLTLSGLFPSMFNGSLYDKNKNRDLRPNTELKMSINGNVVEIYVPKKYIPKPGEKGKPLLDSWNEMGTNMYYMTPRSIFRTLFYNGEGFAYLLNKQLSLLDANSVLGKGITGAGLNLGAIQKGILSHKAKDYSKFVEGILQKAKATLSPKELKYLERTLNRAGSLSRLTHRFSFPLRMQTKLSKIFEAKALKLRAKVAKWFLSNPRIRSLIVKNGAGKLLGRWIAKGGVDVLARTVVTAIFGALGMTVGPIGSFLATALSWVATDLILKATGAILNIFKYALIGLIAILGLVIFISTGSVKKFNKTTYSANLTPPGDVLQCQLYELVPLDPNAPSPWGPAIISPPSGEECPIGTGSIRCTQGWVDNISSHTNITQLMPVDLAYTGELKAPQFCTQGDCKVTSVWQIQCDGNNHAGGAVIFSASTGSVTYTFTTYHVKPVVSVGEKVMSGQTYAVVQMPPEVSVGSCWTGPHLHFEAKQDGVPVDPMELLQEFNCGVPDESGCM
jgi:hypothetical protein